MTSAIANRCSLSVHDWTCRRVTELIDHIVQQHHAALRRSLSTLNQLAVQCAADRSSHRVAVASDLRRILAALTQELTLHMHKEELVLFPWIRQLESGADEYATQSRSLTAAIEMMRQEHRYIREGLARLRWLTQDAAPITPCRADYRALSVGLVELEAELRQQFHEEDQILFPRAIDLEAAAIG